MAGDWIKIEATTPDKPEVLRMARLIGIEPDAVVGKLFKMWAWFDKNSVDGVVDGVVDSDVDALVKQIGFSAAAIKVGWLMVDDDSERVSIPNFGAHNGETAKKRALKNKRQSRWRRNVDADVDAKVSTRPSQKASTREEKRREYIYKEHFERFWNAGLCKRGGKDRVFQRFKKLAGSDPEQFADELISDIQSRLEANQFGFEKLHPATYLNQSRWQDEAPEPDENAKVNYT